MLTLTPTPYQTGALSRWKWAFRDTAKKDTQPTMIRTRRGLWRQATVFEEATRSWVRNPSQLDLQVFRSTVKELSDPDGDEHEAQQLKLAKTARRKELLSEGKQ